jgi:hypothetical protein
MTDRELMQQALDALIETVRLAGEYGTHLIRNDKDAGHAYETIEALRARLAQPEPEPVAWITGGEKGELWWHQSEKFDTEGNLIGKNPDDVPLYTAPPQRKWQGLTDEDMNKLRHLVDWTVPLDIKKFARAIEVKLKEKNHG